MRTLCAWIAVSLVVGGQPCLAQSGRVQSITDKDPQSVVENLGFERKQPDGDEGVTSDWRKGGQVPKKDSLTQLTASEANKANYVSLAGGGGYRIDRVIPGPNDKIVSVTIIYNSRFVDLPGASISKGDRPGTLKTGLTSEDLKKF
jgi:hypothetical protein